MNRAQQQKKMKKEAKRKAKVKSMKQKELADRRRSMHNDIMCAVQNIRDDIMSQIANNMTPVALMTRMKVKQNDDGSWTYNDITILPPMKNKRSYNNDFTWDDKITLIFNDTGKIEFTKMYDAIDALFSSMGTNKFDEFITILTAEGKIDMDRIMKKGDSYMHEIAEQYYD